MSNVLVVPTGASNTASFIAVLLKMGVNASQGVPTAQHIREATHVVVPGVGTFGAVMQALAAQGFVDALKDRIAARRPTLLVCAGLQILADSSEESPGVVGLGAIRVPVVRFGRHLTVPQQAWNLVTPVDDDAGGFVPRGFAFYSNSYCVTAVPLGWRASLSTHGDTTFVAALQAGGVLAMQFHPELSAAYGKDVIGRWLAGTTTSVVAAAPAATPAPRALCRVICCMDVNAAGRVVKGVQFRNLADAGDPVELAEAYEKQGADELVILDVSATVEGRANATQVVRAVRSRVSLPITVGGGVRSVADAAALLDAGADKVAVNSAAVEDPMLLASLAARFGAQCVVLSIDGKRMADERWNVVTKSGAHDTGRDVVHWAREGATLGAGEILLTSLDRDGTGDGFDCDMLRAVAEAVRVPVVASGGAKSAAHMVAACRAGAAAVLAASIFHFGVATVGTIKSEMAAAQVSLRPAPVSASVTENRAAQPVIPCIDLMGGRAVQLVGGEPQALQIDAGDPLAVARAYCVGGELAVVDLDAAISGGTTNNRAVVEQLIRLVPCRVGGGIRDVDTARSWLDAGARRVVIGSAASVALLQQLPRERVVVALDCRDGIVVTHGWKTSTGLSVLDRLEELAPHTAHFLVTFVEHEGRMQGVPLDRVAQMVAVLRGRSRLTVAGGITTAAEVAALDALGCEAQIGMAMYSGRLPLADALWAAARPARNGLLPTVVCDEANRALGLCYSSIESFRLALSQRRGVYFSRSRNTLWTKGESSGATQELLRVALDCDRDCVRFVVRQASPGFCHRPGSFSCFGGPPVGMAALEDTIARRLVETAEEHSYTRRLFADPTLLAAKLREEVQELIEATEPGHVAEELADVLYFALVKAAKHGVTLEAVERVLDSRALKITRRPGLAKEPLPPAPASASATVVVVAPPPTQRDTLLKRLPASQVASTSLQSPVDPAALAAVQPVLDEVRAEGLPALLRHAVRLGDLAGPVDARTKVCYGPEDMRAAHAALDPEQRALLGRVAARVRAFAQHQRGSLQSTRFSIPGGVAGQRVSAMQRAGVYAPGGRYPLPSSVLMGAVTARVAGVPHVVVASPRPHPVILAACHEAGADCLLAIGGAQAIAALAYGIPQLPAFAQGCDVVTGPGNKWVTAAKFAVAGTVAIDMLAGPSECLVCCDPSVRADFVAADLLAQAEHDVEARPILVVMSEDADAAEAFVVKVEAEMRTQLAALPTRDVAAEAVARHGVAVVGVATADQAVDVLDCFAAEHVELHGRAAEALQNRLKHYGSLFVGALSAEVMGDYGAGPNHTLPTGGSARSFSGLSVHTFLKKATFLQMSGPGCETIAADALAMGLMEGLHGHANAARIRLESLNVPTEAAAAGGIAVPRSLGGPQRVRLALPKGRMMDQVLELLSEAGMKVQLKGRELRPKIASMPHFEIKMLKPRNCVEMLDSGTRQFAFVGSDLLRELGASNVVSVLDTGLDPVRLVAAVPEAALGPNGELPQRHLIIATEYQQIAADWITRKGLDAEILHVSGSTEVFPPDDADMIIDNTATGSTLEANRLSIVDVLLSSSTHLCVHRSVLDNPSLKAQMDELVMLLRSALEARNKVVLEFNVSTEGLEQVCLQMPAMKKPTINSLFAGAGYAIKVVVNTKDVPSLIPKIKSLGGSDILVSKLKNVLP